MRNLQILTIFARAAECRSFTKAGDRLGISASGVSKAISRLEDELSVKLLNRTTRTVALTDEGAIFFERCRQILSDIEDAEAAVASSRAKPRGRLRVQMPVGFGRHVILPAIPKFLEENSELTLDVELSDRIADLTQDGLDAVISLGPLRDSSLMRKKLYQTRIVTVASPSYLEKHGAPQTPDDLDNHRFLGHLEPRTGGYRGIEFHKDGEKIVKHPSGHINVNNSQSLLEMGVAGLGVVRLATFVCADAVRSGSLRVVLDDWTCYGPEICMLYSPSRHLSPRIQVFNQFLSGLIPARPQWDEILLNN